MKKIKSEENDEFVHITITISKSDGGYIKKDKIWSKNTFYVKKTNSK